MAVPPKTLLAPRLSLYDLNNSRSLRVVALNSVYRVKPVGRVAWPFQPRVPLSLDVRREGAPSVAFLAQMLDPVTGYSLANYTHETPNPQFFAREAIFREVIAQVYEYTEPRLGMTRWPTISETASTLLFNISEGSGGNQVSTVPAAVDVFATVDNLSQVREALVVERMDDGQWRVAGYGATVPDALNTLDLKVTTSGVLYALGLDDYGTRFVPNKAVVVGERVRPTTYGGWVYEVTEAGSLPAEEPVWWAAVGDNTSRVVGTCRVQARRYYQPVSHGPIKVELV